MATTTNFGWETPDDNDLVSQGAAAMRTLGSAIDTSLVDLKGGTTGQALAKNSNTDMDFKWIGVGWVELASGSLNGTNKVTLTGISQDYTDLRLVLTSFTQGAGAGPRYVRIGDGSFKANSTSNYVHHVLYVDDPTSAWSIQNEVYLAVAGAAYHLVCDIPNYTDLDLAASANGIKYAQSIRYYGGGQIIFNHISTIEHTTFNKVERLEINSDSNFGTGSNWLGGTYKLLARN